jgi:type III secretion apparatus needle protein
MTQDELAAAMSSLTDQQGMVDELKRAVEKLQQDPQSPDNLMQMQILMQKWSMAVEMQSRMVQQLNDALKSIVTKIG